jgi:uncharacterized protein YbaR (Trm112 family)
MNDWLMEILRCPISGEKLHRADAPLVERLRARQQSADLFSHKGIAVEQPFEAGLVNQSATYFYRVADDIPTLLPDEAIALEQP